MHIHGDCDVNFGLRKSGARASKKGDSFLKQQQWDEAIAAYNEAIELDPKNVAEVNPKLSAAYADRGISHDFKGDYDKAITDYTKAIELDPKVAAAYNSRGLAYYKEGDYDKARADLSTAKELGYE